MRLTPRAGGFQAYRERSILSTICIHESPGVKGDGREEDGGDGEQQEQDEEAGNDRKSQTERKRSVKGRKIDEICLSI